MHLTRRQFMASAIGATAALGFSRLANARQKDKPNILLIVERTMCIREAYPHQERITRSPEKLSSGSGKFSDRTVIKIAFRKCLEVKRKSRFRVDVDLSDYSCSIPGIFEISRKVRRIVFVHAHSMCCQPDLAVVVRIQPCEYRSPRWAAPRLSNIRMFKPDAPACQGIQARS